MIRVKCQCGAQYRVPEKLAGKRAKCKHCAEAIPIPALPDTGAPKPPPLPRAKDDREKKSSAQSGAAATVDKGDDDAPFGGSLFDDLPTAADGTYSVGEAVETERPTAVVPEHVPLRTEAAHTRKRGFGGFWKDAAWSFLFVVDPGSLISFLIVGALFALLPLISMIPFGGLIALVIIGWTAGFLLNVMSSAANGEPDLPTLMATEGWWDDIIAPFFRMLGAALVCFAPGFSYGFYLGFTAPAGVPVTISPTEETALNLIAALMWPMVVLVVGLGGFSALLRVDLILATIGKTLLPYLATVALTGGVIMLGAVASDALQFGAPAAGRNPMAMLMVLLVLQLYISVATMRVIGLYYHHFKDRFAWSWD